MQRVWGKTGRSCTEVCHRRPEVCTGRKSPEYKTEHHHVNQNWTLNQRTNNKVVFWQMQLNYKSKHGLFHDFATKDFWIIRTTGWTRAGQMSHRFTGWVKWIKNFHYFVLNNVSFLLLYSFNAIHLPSQCFWIIEDIFSVIPIKKQQQMVQNVATGGTV